MYILNSMLGGCSQDLYSFTLEPFLLADNEPYNHRNSTSPDVRWTQQKVCTIPTKEGRVVAVNMESKFTPKRVRFLSEGEALKVP